MDAEDMPGDMAANFGSVEYVVFGAVLALSASIGVYFGCFGSRQKTTDEFLKANREMSSVPVALSLVCSFVSAITILGQPAEIYLYGTQSGLAVVSFIWLTLSLSYLYVPVFFQLNVSSLYEYLELRFGSGTRMLISAMAVFHVTIYMAIVVLAPAQALEQVTGLNMRLSTAAIFLVCIFYSSLGGLKAVLWTDALQALIMIGSLAVVAIKGVYDVGGIDVIWKRAEDSGRVNFFNFDADPRTRHTFWSATIGGYFMWIPLYAATQAQIQRYMAVPNLNTCRRALWMNMIGLMAVIMLCFFAGLVLYARYFECDPLKSGAIANSDMLLPYFVMDTSGKMQGIPGLFVAGITCASLSSVSSGLSAAASIITYDYIKKLLPGWPDEKLSLVSKIMCVVFGVVSFGFIFVVENMGNILPVTSNIIGMIVGPTLGVFTLGMFFPWAHARASVTSLLISIAVMFAYAIGVFIANNDKLLPDQRLPLSTDGCTNATHSLLSAAPSTSPWLLTHSTRGDDWKNNGDSLLIKVLSISYVWFPGMGTALTFGLGVALTFLMPRNAHKTYSSSLFSPLVLRFWKHVCPKEMSRLLDPLEGLVKVDLEEIERCRGVVKVPVGGGVGGVDNLGADFSS